MRTLYYAVAAQSYFGLKGIMALMIYLLCIGQEVCIGKNCVCSLNFGLALPSKTRAQFPKLTGLDQLTTFFIPNCYFLNVTAALVTIMG